MDDHLDGILQELGRIQESLARDVASDDYTHLRRRQAELRARAREARRGLVDDLSLDQLRHHLAHLEHLRDEHIGSRLTASAAVQTGHGGGIDPQYLHEMNRKMAETFGLDDLTREIEGLRNRIRSLEQSEEGEES